MSQDAKTFEYDIAFSFAGEQRREVHELAEILSQKGVKVFYDEHNKSQLWGKNLYQYLQSIYKDKAQYCVVCVSCDYAKKAWPMHELEQAQARAFIENREYILPLRFDDTPIPGINDTIGFVDYNSHSPMEIVNILAQKIDASQEPIPAKAVKKRKIRKAGLISVISFVATVLTILGILFGDNLVGRITSKNIDEYFKLRGNVHAFAAAPTEEAEINDEGGYKLILSNAFQKWFSTPQKPERIVGSDIDLDNVSVENMGVRAFIDKEEYWDVSSATKSSYKEFLTKNPVDKRSEISFRYTNVKMYLFEHNKKHLYNTDTLLVYFSAIVESESAIYDGKTVYVSIYYEATGDAVYVVAVENYTNNNDYLVEFHKMVNSFYLLSWPTSKSLEEPEKTSPPENLDIPREFVYKEGGYKFVNPDEFKSWFALGTSGAHPYRTTGVDINIETESNDNMKGRITIDKLDEYLKIDTFTEASFKERLKEKGGYIDISITHFQHNENGGNNILEIWADAKGWVTAKEDYGNIKLCIYYLNTELETYTIQLEDWTEGGAYFSVFSDVKGSFELLEK